MTVRPTCRLCVIELYGCLEFSSFPSELCRYGLSALERLFDLPLLIVRLTLLPFQSLTMQILTTQTGVAAQHAGEGVRAESRAAAKVGVRLLRDSKGRRPASEGRRSELGRKSAEEAASRSASNTVAQSEARAWSNVLRDA